MPADQIEKPVRQSLLDFFTSSEQLIDAIGQKLSANQMRQLITTARQVGQRIEKAPASTWREELTGVLHRVTVGTGRMRVQISRSGLLAKLGMSSESLDDHIELWAYEVAYTLRNRGRQLKILPDGITQTTHSEPDPTLLKLLSSRQLLKGDSRLS